MSDLRKAAELALKALEELRFANAPFLDEAMEALRTTLAQPEPEPVAWHEPGAYGNVTTHKDWALANGWEPLYKEKNT
jgi:hypothetical protein